MYFAKIDSNNVVLNVIVADQEFISKQEGTWIQAPDKKVGTGYLWDPIKGVFVSPQPFPSWVLDQNNQWRAPVPMPGDGKLYLWDEPNTNWKVAKPKPLNEQYTKPEFGQSLIDRFSVANTERGLTSDELFLLAQNLGPYYLLLQIGALQTFYDKLGTIPVDGVVITQGVIDEFKQAVGAYLGGL